MNEIEKKFYEAVHKLTKSGYIAQGTIGQRKIELHITCDDEIFEDEEQSSWLMPVKAFITGNNHKIQHDMLMCLDSQRTISDGYVVDFLLCCNDPSISIAIEIDGHEWHEKTKEQAKRDKERSRFLLRSGCPEIRFTGSEIYTQTVDSVKEMFDTFAGYLLSVIA